MDWSTTSWDGAAPVGKGSGASWTWNCNASGYQSAWQSGSWNATGGTDGDQDGKRRKTWTNTGCLIISDNGAASSSGPRRTSLLSQESRLNEELRLACASTTNPNFKLPENKIWVPPVADRTTAPVKAMGGWYKRRDFHNCIEHDRLRLIEAVKPHIMMRIRGRWREHECFAWTPDVLLNLTTAPFSRLYLNIVNEERTTMQPGDPTMFTNVIVLATYGLGAALEGDVLPPLCFPTSSTKGKPRDKESHVLNRLLTKLINKKLFEPSQPGDTQLIRSKCAPWQSDRDLNEFVAELQMDTAELSVKM